MADHYWRLVRFRRFETGLMQDDDVSTPQLTAVQRFMNTAEQSRMRSRKVSFPSSLKYGNLQRKPA